MDENNKYPLVSIICICWNHENYLAKCLASINNQSYKNIEIIFLDNNSKDESCKKAKELLEKSANNYVLIERKENNGISNNLNLALSKCQGKYLIALSTDDWLTTDSVEKKVNYLEKFPQYGLVYSNGYIFYENQNLTMPHIVKNAKQGKVFNELLKGNFVFIIGAMLNVKVLKEIGGYNENSAIEDWDICLRISQKHEIGYINEQLAFYRKHDHNISNKLYFMLKNELSILENYNGNLNAKIGIINAYIRYYRLSLLKKMSNLPFYASAKKMYNKIK